jgi:hypothetical protein
MFFNGIEPCQLQAFQDLLWYLLIVGVLDQVEVEVEKRYSGWSISGEPLSLINHLSGVLGKLEHIFSPLEIK